MRRRIKRLSSSRLRRGKNGQGILKHNQSRKGSDFRPVSGIDLLVSTKYTSENVYPSTYDDLC